MTKALMVRCYLLCLLTLALCCDCGLVWADSSKASDSLIETSTVGVPSLVHHAIPADDDWLEVDEAGTEEELPRDESSTVDLEKKEKLGIERTPHSPN
ncbi:uncharacterized protein TM35_000501400, partial [Trypanosoma theileri]